MRICFRLSADGWYCVTKGNILRFLFVFVEGLKFAVFEINL